MSRRLFTLAELLVALVVAAVVIPVSLRALLTAGALDESAAYRRQATRLADLKLHELVVTGDWVEAEDAGQFGDDYPDYSWELVTDEWSAVDVTMRELRLTVSGPARVGHTTVTVTTLVPEPEEE